MCGCNAQRTSAPDLCEFDRLLSALHGSVLLDLTGRSGPGFCGKTVEAFTIVRGPTSGITDCGEGI